MYDFVTRVDRKGTGSSKWEAMYRANPDVPQGIVPFSVADMEFVQAPQVKDALVSFAETAVLGYTTATDSYFDSVLDWQRAQHDWNPKREWVSLSPGVVPAIRAAIRAFSEPGDGVIVMPPVYYPFRSSIEESGRVVVENPLLLLDGSRYEIDFDGLEALCSNPRTTMLILCNPHNPVGRVWSVEELTRVASICCEHNVFICSDEIHGDLIMPGFKHTVIASVLPEGCLDNCMVCTAPSKTFNLAGLQCSNIFIPDSQRKMVFDRVSKADMGFFTLNAFAYPVCEAVYRTAEPWLREAIQVIADNHRIMKEYCARYLPMLRVFPLEGTYLQWVDCRALGLSAEDLERFMQREALLFLDEGAIFGTGGAGFERFNIACPRSVLLEALERLKRAVDGLRVGRVPGAPEDMDMGFSR